MHNKNRHSSDPNKATHSIIAHGDPETWLRDASSSDWIAVSRNRYDYLWDIRSTQAIGRRRTVSERPVHAHDPSRWRKIVEAGDLCAGDCS